MSLTEAYSQGGWLFMLPLTIIFIINLILILFVGYCNLFKKSIQPTWYEVIKQLGGLALAWGAFSTLVGLYQAFADLERMTETLPLNIIMGGLKVALITTLYGFGIFLFAQLALIVLRLRKTEG